MPVRARGNADKRTIMGGDKINHTNATTYPWHKSGASPQTIDIAEGQGLAVGAVLTDDFSCSHILVSLNGDSSTVPTLTINYKVENGGTARTIVHYLSKTAGIQVVPLGLLFPAGSDDVSIVVANSSVNVSMTLCGVN